MEKVSKTLSAHLSKVTDCIARLDNYGDRIPQIEIDILLSGLRDMYTEACQISCCNEIGPHVETEVNVEEKETVAEETPVLNTAAVIAPLETLMDDEKDTDVIEPEEPEQTTLPLQDSPVHEPPQDLPQTDNEASTGISPLMVDTEATPTYAEEEAATETFTPSQEQPTMEELEGNPNDNLFTETAENNTTKDPSSIPVQTEQPQTLWDKLQETKPSPTLGESVVAGKTISDLFAENHENANPSPIPATPVKTQQPISVEEPDRTEPIESTLTHTHQEEPTKPVEEPIHQSSLFDYLKKGEAPQPTTATLADSLKNNKDESFEQKINTARVSDLRTIININDKFSFMNELFHNNMKGYNDFILRLNAIADRDEAMAYVNSVASQYDWDERSAAVQTFFKVFDRKF